MSNTLPSMMTTPSLDSINSMNEDDQREQNLHCYGIYATDAEVIAILEEEKDEDE